MVADVVAADDEFCMLFYEVRFHLILRDASRSGKNARRLDPDTG